MNWRKKTLAAVQGNSIDLENLEDIIRAQEYRLNIWPTPKPSEGLEVRQTAVLQHAHERLPDGVKPAFELKISDPLPLKPRPRVVKPDGEQDPPPAA